MIIRLLPGSILIPLSYWIYTNYSYPRFRCHVPSWSISSGHFLFEMVPYIFILTSFTLLFRTARYALLHNSEIYTNIFTLALAFQFSVFTFAVGYYQFGRIVEPNMYDYVANILIKIDDLKAAAASDGLSQVAMEPIAGTVFSVVDGDVKASHPISSDIWDYVRFSLSVPLGDDKITGVTLCPYATVLRVLQDLSNLAFGLLSVIILVRFEPQQKSNSKEG